MSYFDPKFVSNPPRGLNNTPKLRVTGLCEEKSSVTSEFPTQRATNAENVPFDDVKWNFSMPTEFAFSCDLLSNMDM